MREAYERLGIPVLVEKHPLSGVHSWLPYRRAVTGFADRIRELGVDVVYGNTLQTFYAIHAGALAGLPCVWNPRESEPWQSYFDHFGPAIAKQALECFEFPYQIVFVANATKDGCAPLNSHHNFLTIHNGLDRSRLAAGLAKYPRAEARNRLQVGDDEVCVLLLGTVCERKGQIDLVRAAGRVKEATVRKMRFLIVGDRPSPYSDNLKQELAGLRPDCRARVEVLPETPETGHYFAAADIFVCASRVESFPRVILEAMLSGLPVVTTPVNGIPEQVQEGVNALFYPPGDAGALAGALERLVTDERLRRKMAANSPFVLDAINDYESMAAMYARVFREAWLSGGPRVCAELSD
jgi:glycosyltransferase involved in cell wall biosynthesis